MRSSPPRDHRHRGRRRRPSRRRCSSSSRAAGSRSGGSRSSGSARSETTARPPPLSRRSAIPTTPCAAKRHDSLWAIWHRSGDPAIDIRLGEGIALMQAGRLPESVAVFTDVIATGARVRRGLEQARDRATT